MARIDHDAFAEAFSARLRALRYSLRSAEEKWPLTDRAMLSRAINGKALSAGNFLLLCEMAGLNPFAFLDRGKDRQTRLKSILDHMVTDGVARET